MSCTRAVTLLVIVSCLFVDSPCFVHALHRNVSFLLCTTVLAFSLSYTDPAIQHKHEVEKEAMKEYYDKHGGAPHH